MGDYFKFAEAVMFDLLDKAKGIKKSKNLRKVAGFMKDWGALLSLIVVPAAGAAMKELMPKIREIMGYVIEWFQETSAAYWPLAAAVFKSTPFKIVAACLLAVPVLVAGYFIIKNVVFYGKKLWAARQHHAKDILELDVYEEAQVKFEQDAHGRIGVMMPDLTDEQINLSHNEVLALVLKDDTKHIHLEVGELYEEIGLDVDVRDVTAKASELKMPAMIGTFTVTDPTNPVLRKGKTFIYEVNMYDALNRTYNNPSQALDQAAVYGTLRRLTGINVPGKYSPFVMDGVVLMFMINRRTRSITTGRAINELLPATPKN